MKPYGAKRTYADCRTSKPLGKPIKVEVAGPQNPKAGRAVDPVDLEEVEYVDRPYDLVQFGMRGSVAGISHWEVHKKGHLIGETWKGKDGLWRAKPYRADAQSFKTRREGCEWLLKLFTEGQDGS